MSSSLATAMGPYSLRSVDQGRSHYVVDCPACFDLEDTMLLMLLADPISSM